MNPIWTMIDHRYDDGVLGYVPLFLNTSDPAPAKEQFEKNYIGGWFPLMGWKFDPITRKLTYPGDQELKPIAETKLRDETILMYPSAWVMILQPNGNYEVSRLD